MRGATIYVIRNKIVIFISIHAPLCGGRHEIPDCDMIVFDISIHAPLCGGRLHCFLFRIRCDYFNPRPPVRGATMVRIETASSFSNFNPRPPVRGATLIFRRKTHVQ